MASNQEFSDYVCEQAGLPGRVTTQRMFGEFALYLDGKVVALLCDNEVFVKPTEPGRQLLGAVSEAPPYPGAKLYFRVNELLDDHALFQQLLIATAGALPTPKPKAAKPVPIAQTAPARKAGQRARAKPAPAAPASGSKKSGG